MKDTNVLNIRERRATICRITAAAVGAQAAEQTSHQDQKQSEPPTARSTHLDDLRLCVLRPESLGRGGHTHCHKAVWFPI